MGRLETKTDLRKAFDEKRMTVTAYAKGRFTASTLSDVLNGKLTGTKNRAGSEVREIILQLQEDGIWIGDLPWKKE